MQNVIVERGTINFEALDSALRSALGEWLIGLSTGGGKVQVHLEQNTPPAQIEQVRSIVEDHDPNELTLGQQAEVERQQQLEQMREANAEPLDMAAYAEADELIRQLAARVAWLEQEIVDLRGLYA